MDSVWIDPGQEESGQIDPSQIDPSQEESGQIDSGAGRVFMAQEFKPSFLELQTAIRSRAAEVYRQSGAVEGHDLENWRQAEAEILRETGAHLSRPAVVISLEGVVYTGEYDFASAGGYTPGEWRPGDRVPVRIEGDRLFLRRPNGHELETSVVKRIG